MSADPGADRQPISDRTARPEGERARQPFLVFRGRDDREQVFVFPAGAMQASVGRSAPSDLLLDWDDQVSRLHARFERVRDSWEVIDDGLSTNGTFVNGERLSGRRRLTDGDSLRFGTTTAVFRSPDRAQSQAADAAKVPSAVGLSTTQRRVLAALCRPYKGASGFATPAADAQIAEELVLSVGEVRAHLWVLYAKLSVEELPQDQKRVRLVERAFSAGLISDRDL